MSYKKRQPATASSKFFSLGFCQILLIGCSCCLSSAVAAQLSDTTLTNLSFEQKLGAQVSLDLQFRDEQGKVIALREYFGKKPVILVPGYYGCPMLCTLVLNGMVESLQDVRWTIGKEFAVVNFSIDSRETSTLAASKKRTYLKRYGRDTAAEGWHFLTGEDAAIRQLASEIGFEYAYDDVAKQYAHPSGFIVLTPDGKIARYFFGVTFPASEVFTAIQGASARTIGSRIRDLILLCFHYRPVTGKYSAAVMTIVRALGIATVLGLGGLIIHMGTQANRKPDPAESACESTHVAGSP